MGGEGQTAPRLGAYRGHTKDFSCPGDNVSWEVLLLGGNQAALECIPSLNYFQGGQPPWRCEGTWEWDEDDMEIVISITKQDAIGPRKDSDVKIPVCEDGALTFKGTRCAWAEAAPCPQKAKMATMTLRELKAALIAIGVDPVGCLERADFESKLIKFGLPPEPKAEAKTAGYSSVEAAGADPTPAAPTPDATPATAAVPAAEAAPAASAPVPEAAPASAPAAHEGVTYSLEELKDKRVWEKLDVVAGERETYLAADVFKELFGVTKADFAKQPKWKKDNAKKKHGLF